MPRTRYSNPVENLHSYVQVHRGIDMDERLRDVEWVKDVMNAADKVMGARATIAGASVQGELGKALDELREALTA